MRTDERSNYFFTPHNAGDVEQVLLLHISIGSKALVDVLKAPKLREQLCDVSFFQKHSIQFNQQLG